MGKEFSPVDKIKIAVGAGALVFGGVSVAEGQGALLSAPLWAPI